MLRPRLATALVPLIASLLLTHLPPTHADPYVWTDDDENTGVLGYQEALPEKTGLRCDVYPDITGYAYVSTDPVKVGSNCIDFQYEFLPTARLADRVMLRVYADEARSAVDVSGQTYLNFRVQGVRNNQVMKVLLLDAGNHVSNEVLVNSWTKGGISSTQWHEFTVPLATLDPGDPFDMTQVKQVMFYVTGDIANKEDGVIYSLYLDNIYFNGPLAVRWPRESAPG